MSENRVSANLSQADAEAVMAALNTIREKLPFLIDLSPEERRSLPKMGAKSQVFVSAALTVAQQNPDMLPRSFDVTEMGKDVALATTLEPIVSAMTQLQELVQDTYLAVGSEAYVAGLLVYRFAQAADKGAGLDELLDSMGQRFARKSRGTVTTATPPTPMPQV